MKLAEINETPTIVQIVRSRDPYILDLRKTPSVIWYPVLLTVIIWCWRGLDHADGMAFKVWLTFITSLYWFPAITRQVSGIKRFTLTLDLKNRRVLMNGRDWSSFADVQAVVIMTKPGIWCYRRFRLDIKREGGTVVHLVDTPQWSSPYETINYLPGINADKKQFREGNFLQADGLLWRPYIVGMRGYDANDPFIAQIFELNDLIVKSLKET